MWYQRRNSARSVTGGVSGFIVLIGIALAFALGFGSFNLPIFFIALAFAIFIGSLGSLNPRGVVGGTIGAMWMIILALFFITHTWIVFLIGTALSALLGSLMRPIVAALLGLGIFGLASSQRNQQPQQPYYQPPPQQPYQPQQPYYQPPPPSQQPYQSYQQGYQPQPEAYQEGGRQYQYPQSPEQPQAQYPQQMPPQEQ